MKSLILCLAVFASAPTWASGRSDHANFRFSPIGLIVGSLSVDLDFVVSPQWTLGPTLQYWHFKKSANRNFTSDFEIDAFGGGVRANWFRNGVFRDGLFVGPSLTYASVRVKTEDDFASYEGNASGLFLGCLVGYGWFWDSFNIMLGGGLNLGLGATKVAVTDSAGDRDEVRTSIAGFIGEFSLGWTF